jgi:hypothetical protein
LQVPVSKIKIFSGINRGSGNFKTYNSSVENIKELIEILSKTEDSFKFIPGKNRSPGI